MCPGTSGRLLPKSMGKRLSNFCDVHMFGLPFFRNSRLARLDPLRMKLTDVARASLSELQNDLETWLAEREEIPWSIKDPQHVKVSGIKLAAFAYTEDVLHDYWVYLHKQRRLFDPWLKNDDPVVVANALIVLIQRTTGLLSRQMESLEESFVKEGGIRERMHKARTEAAANVEGAPECHECGKAMRRRKSARGDFWGCSAYPDCRATRAVDAAS